METHAGIFKGSLPFAQIASNSNGIEGTEEKKTIYEKTCRSPEKNREYRSLQRVFISSVLATLLLTNTLMELENAAATAKAPYISSVYPDTEWRLNATYRTDWGASYGLAIDSRGDYYQRTSGLIRKSIDGGSTWTNLKAVYAGGIRCFSGDILLAFATSSGRTDVWRSDDYGISWQKVLTTNGLVWTQVGVASSPNGSLYIGEYNTPNPGYLLWRSYDRGLTWSAFNVSTIVGPGTNHIHCVYAPSDTELLVSVGDSRTTMAHRRVIRSTDGGITFQNLSETDAYTAILKIESKYYLASDSGAGVWTTTDFLTITPLKWLLGEDTSFMGGWGSALEYDNTNNLLYFATESGGGFGSDNGLFISPDLGGHWLLAFRSVGYGILQFAFDTSRQKIFMHLTNATVIEMTMPTNAEVRHLIGKYRIRQGGNSYIGSDGEDVWLSNYEKVVNKATLTLKNATTHNLIADSSFEQGGAIWTGTGGNVSDEKALYGQSSLKLNHTGEKRQESWIPVSPSKEYVASVYVLNTGGVNTPNAVEVLYVQEYTSNHSFIKRSFDGYLQMNVLDCWLRMSWNFTTSPTSGTAIVSLSVQNQIFGEGQAFYFDGAMLCLANRSRAPYVNGTSVLWSKDVSVSVNGQTAYQFPDLTIPRTVPILGILAGLINISIRCSGSRLVNLSISGTEVAASDGFLCRADSGSSVGIIEARNASIPFTIFPGETLNLNTGGRFSENDTISVSTDLGCVFSLYDWAPSNNSVARWMTSSSGSVTYDLSGLLPNATYDWLVDGLKVTYMAADSLGTTSYAYSGPSGAHEFMVRKGVNPPAELHAAFEYVIDGALVTFTDISDGIAVAWSWDFGDNADSSIQNPIHEYASSGRYLVTLTIYDNQSHSGTANAMISIDLSPGSTDDKIWGISIYILAAVALVAVVFSAIAILLFLRRRRGKADTTDANKVYKPKS